MNKPDIPLTQSTFQAGLIQSRAFRNLQSLMAQWLIPHNINVTEWALLGVLREHGSHRPNELANILNVSFPLCTRIINKLEKLSLVHRSQSSTDGRGLMISLTPTGTAFTDEVEQTVRNGMRDAMAGIPREQLAGYLLVLKHLSDLSS